MKIRFVAILALLAATALPAGTMVDLESYADNSSANPVNPNSPPRLVTFGEQSTNEMCIGFIGCTADNDAEFLDLLRLRRPGRQAGAAFRKSEP